MMLRQLFSRRVGYAAHALSLMAQMQPHATVPVADLARQMTRTWPRTSATYLSKVVQSLVEAGILASVRGSAGGYCLAQRPDAISLFDVVCALEGTFDGRCPLTPNGPCAVRARCRNYSALLQLQDDFSRLLSRITIEQLARSLPSGSDAGVAAALCAHPVEPSPGARQNHGSDYPPTFPAPLLNFEPATSH